MSRGSVARLVLAAAIVFIARPAGAQTKPPGAKPETISVEPLECWWRTSADAVRIGELFRIVLTCSVLETATTTVVPDQSRLDPSVLQLQPFEITGGTKANDVRTDYRRFFQYEYTARYLGEEFGQELRLPPLSVSYRVQSRVQNEESVESRERDYILPTHPIRILSLVPGGASDIRERPPDTFQQIEARRFRGTVLRVIALALFGLGGVALVVAIAGLARRRGPRTAIVRHASDAAILAAAARELRDIRSRQQSDGWSPDLAAQALAPLRVAATYALGRRVAQFEAERDATPAEGQLLLRPTLRGRKRTLVSGAATADALGYEIRRAEQKGESLAPAIRELHMAITEFSAVAYGRANGAGRPDLDGAFETGAQGLAHVQRDHAWPARLRRAVMHLLGGAGRRAWAR